MTNRLDEAPRVTGDLTPPSVADHAEIIPIDSDADRERWLELRRSGLGGSDIGAILGLNPYRSEFSVWLEKTGRLEPEDISGKEAVYWGNRLEDIVADEFSVRTGASVWRPMAMYRSKTHPALFANPDRFYVEDPSLTPGILECKTAGEHVADHWDDDSIPPWYEAQVVHYAAVTGLRRAQVAVLIAGQRFETRTVELSDELVGDIADLAQRWWDTHVVGDTAPDVDWSDDCTDSLNRLWEARAETLTVDDDALAVVRDYVLARDAEKAASREKKLAGNRLRALLGEHKIAVYGEDRTVATWKPVKEFDEAAFAAAHPKVYAEFCNRFDLPALREAHPALVQEFRADGERRIYIPKAVAAELTKETPDD